MFWISAAAILSVHITLAWLCRQPGIVTVQDDAAYVLLARALTEGSYRELFHVGQPVHSLYPPGYPLVLALWGAIAGTEVDRLLLVNLFASSGALALVAATMRRIWSPWGALLVVLVLAINPLLVMMAGRIRSEPLFTFWIMAALGALARRTPETRHLMLAGAATVAAGLTRGIGVALVGAVALLWLLQRRMLALGLFAVVSAVTVGGWLWWSFTAPEQYAGASYAVDLVNAPQAGRDFLGRIIAVGARIGPNAVEYGTVHVPYAFPLPTVEGTIVDNVIGSLALALLLMAGLVRLARAWPVAALYVSTTGVILLIWPDNFGRLLAPLLPVLAAMALWGAAVWAGRRRQSWELPASVGVASLILLAAAGRAAADVRLWSTCQRGGAYPAASCLVEDQASFFAALAQLATRARADEAVLSMKPQTIYYYTGRQGVNREAALALRPSELVAFLQQRNARYVLLGHLQWAERRLLPDLLEPNCTAFDVLGFYPPRTYLFELRDQPYSSGGPACRAITAYRAATVEPPTFYARQ